MYDFKHQINDYDQFNDYDTYFTPTKKYSLYEKVRNILFVLVSISIVFMVVIFSLKKYDEYSKKQEIYPVKTISMVNKLPQELSHMELTKAITQSVTRNLQTKKALQSINDDELKSIIKRVVNRIEEKPKQIKYSQK